MENTFTRDRFTYSYNVYFKIILIQSIRRVGQPQLFYIVLVPDIQGWPATSLNVTVQIQNVISSPLCLRLFLLMNYETARFYIFVKIYYIYVYFLRLAQDTIKTPITLQIPFGLVCRRIYFL